MKEIKIKVPELSNGVIVFILTFIGYLITLFVGEPDLHDAWIKYVMPH